MFESLRKEQEDMSDENVAVKLFAQGHRAIKDQDLEALKSAVRQLLGLLSRETRDQLQHGRFGGTLI